MSEREPEDIALPPPEIHPSAVLDTCIIGRGTEIGPFVQVLKGAVVGRNCLIRARVTLDARCVLADDVTVMDGAFISSGVHLGRGVFVGPGVVFTNDLRPRSPRSGRFSRRYESEGLWLVATAVGDHASFGANSTVICGNGIGRFALVAAGAVVTRPVPDFALVRGVPARFTHWIDEEGRRVAAPPRGA